MEGLLTTQELTEALFKHMEGVSSTVKHLRFFWHELKVVNKNALDATFGNNLTITLRTQKCNCQNVNQTTHVGDPDRIQTFI